MLKEILTAIFGKYDSSIPEYKPIDFCEYIDPENGQQCTKDKGHDELNCTYYRPSDCFEGQMVSVQWQTEDSDNYFASGIVRLPDPNLNDLFNTDTDTNNPPVL